MSNGGVRAQFQILYGQFSGRRGVEMIPKSSAYVADFYADIWNKEPMDINETKYTLSCGYGNSNFVFLNSVWFELYYVYPKLLACWIQYDLSITMCIRNCSHVEFSMLWALLCVSETTRMLNSVCFEHYYVYPKLLECWIQYALSLTMCIRNCFHVEFSMPWALLCVSETARMLNSVCFEHYYVYQKLLECWIQYALSLNMCIRNCFHVEFSMPWALLCVSETARMLNSVCFEHYYVYPKLLECWIQYALTLTMCIRNCFHVEFSMSWALLCVSESARMLNSVCTLT